MDWLIWRNTCSRLRVSFISNSYDYPSKKCIFFGRLLDHHLTSRKSGINPSESRQTLSREMDGCCYLFLWCFMQNMATPGLSCMYGFDTISNWRNWLMKWWSQNSWNPLSNGHQAWTFDVGWTPKLLQVVLLCVWTMQCGKTMLQPGTISHPWFSIMVPPWSRVTSLCTDKNPDSRSNLSIVLTNPGNWTVSQNLNMTRNKCRCRNWDFWSIPHPKFGQAVPQCWWLPPSGEADRQCGRTAWAPASKRGTDSVGP